MNNTNTIIYKESANTAELYINGVKIDNVTEFSVSKKGAMPAEIAIKASLISEVKAVGLDPQDIEICKLQERIVDLACKCQKEREK